MKRLYPLAAFLFLSVAVLAQSKHYSDMYLQPQKVAGGEHKGYDRYDLGNYALYSSQKRYQPYCYLINSETGKKIFSFQDPLESRKLTHHFFKPDDGDGPIVIITSANEDVSLGVYIFLLEHDNVSKPGFIKYGVDDYNFSSLGFHTLVNEVDGKIELSFADTDIIDYETEKVIDGNTIKFQVTPGNITKIGN